MIDYLANLTAHLKHFILLLKPYTSYKVTKYKTMNKKIKIYVLLNRNYN